MRLQRQPSCRVRRKRWFTTQGTGWCFTLLGQSKNRFINDDVFAEVAKSAQRSAFQRQQLPKSGYEQGALNAARRKVQEARKEARKAQAFSGRKYGSRAEAEAAGAIPDGHNHGGGGAPGQYTPGMQALRDYVTKTWGITNVGGFADRNVAGTNKKSDHALYRAWDFMVGNDRAKGDAIANYIVNNYDKYGVKNLIWYDRIWDPRRGWRSYRHPSGSSNPTLRHRDHPHVGFH